MTQLSDENEHGFTLLELLLAIFIFSIVISMVYGAYNATFKVYSHAERETEVHGKARITMERLTDDLRSAFASSELGIKGESQEIDSRRADSLELLSLSHLNFDHEVQESSTAVIRYSVQEDAETGNLQLYRADFVQRFGGDIDEEEKGFLLCDDLWAVSFTYFDQEGEESEEWTGESDDSNVTKKVMPVMVQIEFSFANSQGDGPGSHFTSAVSLGRVEQ